MRGALFENQIEEYESVFKSNHEYEIANAPLKAVLGRYATREDDCQMSFGGQAMIQDLDPEAEPVEPEYQPIATIPRTADANDRYDVLVIVLFVEDTRSITTSSGVTHEVREVVITDHRSKLLLCTLISFKSITPTLMNKFFSPCSAEQPLTISVWDDLTGTEANLLKSWVGPALVVGFTSLKPSSHKGQIFHTMQPHLE
ncbi:hypothetical protein BVRB_5g101270 [Beta vulgaris subsp. vulgaris]|nr:hypothetical protein BVRB_5g101270 [Beta vulgaris subsp. vulgaris]